MTAEDLQKKSEQYWAEAQTTYLAAAEYYDKQEAVLRSVLAELDPVERLADVGCGDGRYTLVALELAEHVRGYDVSEHLISLAQTRAQNDGLGDQSEFSVGSFAALDKDGPFAVVMCLGVLSAIIDQTLFEQAVSHLTNAVTPSGILLTKDTLANGDSFTSEQGNYAAIYRSADAYVNAFEAAGFERLSRTELTRATETTSNAIYAFRKAS